MGYGNGAIQQSAPQLTHTHVTGSPWHSCARLDAWCTESWKIRCDCCQKNKLKLLQNGENIYVNMRR